MRATDRGPWFMCCQQQRRQGMYHLQKKLFVATVIPRWWLHTVVAFYFEFLNKAQIQGDKAQAICKSTQNAYDDNHDITQPCDVTRHHTTMWCHCVILGRMLYGFCQWWNPYTQPVYQTHSLVASTLSFNSIVPTMEPSPHLGCASLYFIERPLIQWPHCIWLCVEYICTYVCA